MNRTDALGSSDQTTPYSTAKREEKGGELPSAEHGLRPWAAKPKTVKRGASIQERRKSLKQTPLWRPDFGLRSRAWLLTNLLICALQKPYLVVTEPHKDEANEKLFGKTAHIVPYDTLAHDKMDTHLPGAHLKIIGCDCEAFAQTKLLVLQRNSLENTPLSAFLFNLMHTPFNPSIDKRCFQNPFDLESSAHKNSLSSQLLYPCSGIPHHPCHRTLRPIL